MQVPVKITFRHMDPDSSAREQIEHRVEELEQFHDRITACQVVLEAAHRSHQQGKLFHVRVELNVPGRTIVVGRDPAEHHAHEDAHVAIRDAFNAVRRQLEDHARRARGEEKTHAPADIGRIARVFPERGYAFLVTETGEEVYVHANSVPDGGFARLQAGDKVRYVLAPDPGEHGPQASTVVPLGS
jgi:ribosomal subunit interface protein